LIHFYLDISKIIDSGTLFQGWLAPQYWFIFQVLNIHVPVSCKGAIFLVLYFHFENDLVCGVIRIPSRAVIIPHYHTVSTASVLLCLRRIVL